MTVEQLEKANEILDKINELKMFKKSFFYNSGPNIIVAKYIKPSLMGGGIDEESKIVLSNFPDLQDLISGYLSDKIEELEKQLEEL